VAIIRIARFWPSAGDTPRRAAGPSVVKLGPDGLDAFGSEVPPEPPAQDRVRASLDYRVPAARKSTRGRAVTVTGWAVLVLVGLVGVAAAATGVWQYQRWSAQRAVASLVIESTPAGAEVIVAGRAEGRTPLTLSLRSGQYDVRLVGPGGVTRDLGVALAPGATVVRHFEFVAAPVAAATTGALRVQTDPPRLAVSVDGIDRGTSPVTIDEMQPGEHQVVVRSDRGTVRKTVDIQAGQTLSLVISPVESSTVVPGWLAVISPVTLQLKEGGRLIGTTETDRLMLPAGDHEIELVADALGYRTVQKVHVAPGRTAVVNIDPPSGSLSINALPWAEVWVDGERIGETPIANLSRPIGPHEVVFRHPQFGERRETVIVTAGRPARLGLDLRRK
jgi:hypothetical protein